MVPPIAKARKSVREVTVMAQPACFKVRPNLSFRGLFCDKELMGHQISSFTRTPVI